MSVSGGMFQHLIIQPMKSSKSKRWFEGPSYLLQSEDKWPQQFPAEIAESDPEVKTVVSVNTASIAHDISSHLEERISHWEEMRKVVAWILLLKKKLLWKTKKRRGEPVDKECNDVTSIYVELIQEASNGIIKLVQAKHFKEEVEKLKHKKNVAKTSSLATYDPYIDQNGILRVGGRVRRSNLNEECIHPIILPKKSKVTYIIVAWCHLKTAHSGRGMTLNEIRNRGFWVLSATSVVKSVLFNCIICRKLRGKMGEQIMTDLPQDRFEQTPPFTYCAVDMFGPFVVKVKRSDMKSYGAMFTCLASRAVHIEVAHSLSTDSFIQALRRMVARRGNVRQIRSDNGSNFVGAEQELTKAFNEMDHSKIQSFLQSNDADWITWKRNPPAASHMGGVWERQIRSARGILSSLLKTHENSLDEESLQTLVAEAEAVINSRPLTTETLNDGQGFKPLSPSNLLTTKSKVVMLPPGVFQKPDLYCKQRWRRVQHITNEFWCR